MSRYSGAVSPCNGSRETVGRKCFTCRYSSATVSFVDEDASGYRFTRDMSGRSVWDQVEGDDLPMPIEIIVNRAPDGRYVFTGLKIGGEGAWQEITSATLRQIKLSEILAAHFDYFEPMRLIEESLAESSRPIRPPGRRPEDEELRAFARTYLAELGRQPRRAMTAAAKAHNISRATANRWAATCRELGYLPAAREEGEQP